MTDIRLSIDELKKLFLATIDMGNACGATFEDGKIGLGDISALMQFAHSAKDMSLVNFGKAMPQFKDLDASELEELVNLVEENFDIPQDAVEAKVEQILGLAARQYQLVMEAIALYKHPEAVG